MSKKIVEEIDVYLNTTNTKTYCLSYFTQPKYKKIYDDAEILSIKRKPMQHKLELEYKSRIGLFSEGACQRT